MTALAERATSRKKSLKTDEGPLLVAVPEELFLSCGYDEDLLLEETKNGSVVPEGCSCAWLQCVRCGRWVLTPIVVAPLGSVVPSNSIRPQQMKSSQILALPNPRSFCCDWQYCMDGDDTAEFQTFVEQFIHGLGDEKKAANAEGAVKKQLHLDTVMAPLRKSARLANVIKSEAAAEGDSNSDRDDERPRKARRVGEAAAGAKALAEAANVVMCFCCHKMRPCRRPFPGCSHWVCSLGADYPKASCDAPQQSLVGPAGEFETTPADMLARMRRMSRKGIGAMDPRVILKKQEEAARRAEAEHAASCSGRPTANTAAESVQETVKPVTVVKKEAAANNKTEKPSHLTKPMLDETLKLQNEPRQRRATNDAFEQKVKLEPLDLDDQAVAESKTIEVNPPQEQSKSTKASAKTSQKQDVLKWAQCDACQKWRIVTPSDHRKVLKLASWKCGGLGNAASCDDESDEVRFGERGEHLPEDYLKQ